MAEQITEYFFHGRRFKMQGWLWGTTDAWDEGLLGESDAHVALAPIEESERLKEDLVL